MKFKEKVTQYENQVAQYKAKLSLVEKEKEKLQAFKASIVST